MPATISLDPPSLLTRLRSLLPASIATVMAVVLAPWCVVLAFSLPTTTIAAHWSLAWSGLDAAEAIIAALTAYLIHRRSPAAAVTSAMVGTLLLADAWFDVCTSARGLPQLIAVLQAALLEMPLSCAGLWFAAVTIRCAAQAGSSAGTAAGA